MKKALIHVRKSIKLIILIFIATCLIVGVVALIYKPIYSVTINGEAVGYCKNKSKLQTKINEYMENGNKKDKNVAFIQVEDLPEYKMCLLKRGIKCNDNEIFAKIKESGTPYYRYFAILDDGEEKQYVADFATAEATVKALKKKNSANVKDISIVEKYDTKLKDFATKDKAVAKLYEKPKLDSKIMKNITIGRVSTSLNSSGRKASIGISLARPVSGRITSRFGAKSSIRRSTHTGLDIATPSGTPYKAAASGVVAFAGYKGAYGNLLVISHGNGVQTYYGHSSRIYVRPGQSVSQGQVVGAVGSTGNSTGPHLHLEVRLNGVAYNPQYYVY